jgi:CheY-like chemotaxis protein
MARILIIDDDHLVRAAIATLLNAANHDVVATGDGREGLAKIEAERFDLVIVDIFMPGMDGLETINHVRRRSPWLPIVAMSGLSFRTALSARPPDFLAMATKLGAVRSIHKPFKPRELLDTINDCLGRPAGAGGQSG